MRDKLQRQEGEVSSTERDHAAETLALRLYAYATANAIIASAKNDPTRYSACKFARSTRTILRPASAATASPAERTSFWLSRNPRNTRPPATSSHQMLSARAPASGAMRPK